MLLSDLQESINDLIDALPEAGDMRVCFFDNSAQLTHSLWGPEIRYLERDTQYGDETLHESLEDLESNDLTIDDCEHIIVL